MKLVTVLPVTHGGVARTPLTLTSLVRTLTKVKGGF